jgi:outer membrane protein
MRYLLHVSVRVALAVCLSAAAATAQEAAAASRPSDALELSLDDAVALMLRNNLALRSALVDEQIDAARVREALGAFDPTFYAETNYGARERLSPGLFPDPLNPTVFQTRIITSQEDSFDATLGVRGRLVTGATYDVSVFDFYQFQKSGNAFNPIWSTTANLRLTQPLLRGAWSDYAEAEERAATNRLAQTRQTVRGETAARIREVERAYFDVVLNAEDLSTKRRSLEVADALVETSRVKVETGAFPRVEMTSAEAGRAARRSDVMSAEAKLMDSEDRLRRELFSFDAAGEWTVRIRPTETLAPPAAAFRPLEEVLVVARANEPRLIRARLAAAQAEDDLEQRRSDRRPKLDAVANASVTGLDEDGLQPWASLFDRSQNSLTWIFGLQFEVPLGNRAASARETVAELTLTKARIDLKNLEIDVDYNVRKALRDLEVQRRLIDSLAEARRLADEQLENERVKLEAQTTTNLQVFQAEDLRNLRRLEHVQAQVTYRVTLLDLARITGAPLRELYAAP